MVHRTMMAVSQMSAAVNRTFVAVRQMFAVPVHMTGHRKSSIELMDLIHVICYVKLALNLIQLKIIPLVNAFLL